MSKPTFYIIFVPIVDLWSLYDNNEEIIPIVKNTIVIDDEKLNNLKKLCQNKIK